ncbi:MAG: hypothetical protein ACK5VO_13885 [Betaproteobacteria bacterium]|jgi:hypothetical protein
MLAAEQKPLRSDPLGSDRALLRKVSDGRQPGTAEPPASHPRSR